MPTCGDGEDVNINAKEPRVAGASIFSRLVERPLNCPYHASLNTILCACANVEDTEQQNTDPVGQEGERSELLMDSDFILS